MKKILVTGFTPFNGRDVNPSELIVKALTTPENTTLVKLILPVEFRGAEKLLAETVAKERPDCILSLGQAGNAPCLAVEQVAINMDSSLSADGKGLLPDQAGYAPKDEKILTDGPDAYFSTLPIRSLVAAATDAGIAARVSYSAGTYVCNHVMYIGAHIASQYASMISGFVHLPFLPEQLNNPSGTGGRYSMPPTEMLIGVQTILNVLAKPSSDNNCHQ